MQAQRETEASNHIKSNVFIQGFVLILHKQVCHRLLYMGSTRHETIQLKEVEILERGCFFCQGHYELFISGGSHAFLIAWYITLQEGKTSRRNLTAGACSGFILLRKQWSAWLQKWCKNHVLLSCWQSINQWWKKKQIKILKQSQKYGRSASAGGTICYDSLRLWQTSAVQITS